MTESKTDGGVKVQWPVTFGWSAIGALFVAVVLGTTYVLTEDARMTRMESEIDVLRDQVLGQEALVSNALAAINQVDRKLDLVIERMEWVYRFARVPGQETVPYIPWGVAPDD